MSDLRFVLALTRREMRGAPRRFRLFFLCIALGVGALVGVNGFAENLQEAIRREARGLLAGDIEIAPTRPLSEPGRAALEKLRERGIRTARVDEMLAMASSSGRSTLVELKAVEAGYPFYGRLVTEPPVDPNRALPPTQALVEEGLLFRLRVAIGDPIRLGQSDATIVGVIKKEPDRVAGAFSLGPRVMISQEGLSATGLIQPGSRVRTRYLLKLPPTESLNAAIPELKSAFAVERATVTSYEEAQPRLRQFLKNLTRYIRIAGLVTLFVGGIGVSNSVVLYLREKVETIAVLKCLGAESGSVLRIYLGQTLLLGSIGALAGVALGVAVQIVLPALLSRFLPAELPYRLAPLSAVKGIALGLLVTLLFSLPPLVGIRRLPPARVLRRDLQRGAGRLEKILLPGMILAGLIALAAWEVGGAEGRWREAALVVGVLLGSILLLSAAAEGAIRAAARLHPRATGFALRYGLSNLCRPGSTALAALVSVGIGATVILAILLVERSLISEIGENLPKETPSFFFIDIQKDQRERFERLLFEYRPELTPIVRGRLKSVGGREVDRMILEGRSDAWYFQREYVMTFRADLPKGNVVRRGVWWTPERYKGGPLISLEAEAARHLGAGIGSTLTFDIQGEEVTAAVDNLREVDWGSLSQNFFVIFSPGALERFPTTYIATLRVPEEFDLAIQQRVVETFPNVTAINLRSILETVRAMLGRIALAIRFIALFSVAAGLAVLASVIAATRSFRLRESVLLKIIGATRPMIGRIFAVEYALLGAIAGAIGAGLATLLAWVLLKWVMNVRFEVPIGILVSGVITTALVTIAVGFLTTRRILGEKPLAVLREE